MAKKQHLITECKGGKFFLQAIHEKIAKKSAKYKFSIQTESKGHEFSLQAIHEKIAKLHYSNKMQRPLKLLQAFHEKLPKFKLLAKAMNSAFSQFT